MFLNEITANVILSLLCERLVLDPGFVLCLVVFSIIAITLIRKSELISADCNLAITNMKMYLFFFCDLLL